MATATRTSRTHRPGVARRDIHRDFGSLGNACMKLSAAGMENSRSRLPLRWPEVGRRLKRVGGPQGGSGGSPKPARSRNDKGLLCSDSRRRGQGSLKEVWLESLEEEKKGEVGRRPKPAETPRVYCRGFVGLTCPQDPGSVWG